MEHCCRGYTESRGRAELQRWLCLFPYFTGGKAGNKEKTARRHVKRACQYSICINWQHYCDIFLAAKASAQAGHLVA